MRTHFAGVSIHVSEKNVFLVLLSILGIAILERLAGPDAGKSGYQSLGPATQ
jgi:hypothetical protein